MIVSPVYSQSQDSLILLPAYQIEENALLESALKSKALSKQNRYVVNGKSVPKDIFLKTLDTLGDYSFVIQVDSLKKEKVIFLKKK